MDMDQWARVRREVLGDGRSKRSVMSEEGLHWERPRKMLAHSKPPGYRRVRKRVHIIDANGESYRLKDARKRGKKAEEGMIASRRGHLVRPTGSSPAPLRKAPANPTLDSTLNLKSN